MKRDWRIGGPTRGKENETKRGRSEPLLGCGLWAGENLGLAGVTGPLKSSTGYMVQLTDMAHTKGHRILYLYNTFTRSSSNDMVLVV